MRIPRTAASDSRASSIAEVTEDRIADDREEGAHRQHQREILRGRAGRKLPQTQRQTNRWRCEQRQPGAGVAERVDQDEFPTYRARRWRRVIGRGAGVGAQWLLPRCPFPARDAVLPRRGERRQPAMQQVEFVFKPRWSKASFGPLPLPQF